MPCPEGHTCLTTIRQHDLSKLECLLEVERRFGMRVAALSRYHWNLRVGWVIYCPTRLAHKTVERN